MLFTVGGLFALYEAYHKWHEVTRSPGRPGPARRPRWWVPVVVLLGAIALEGMSLRTAMREASKIRGEAGWISFIRRAKAPELPVILLEDFAALLGLASPSSASDCPCSPATWSSTCSAPR